MSEFRVAHDYGMGGAWGLARAHSAAELRRMFPELQVVHEKPAWMTTETENELRTNSSFVVEDPTTYPDWARSLLEEREGQAATVPVIASEAKQSSASSELLRRYRSSQ